jgi:hypothetical protein
VEKNGSKDTRCEVVRIGLKRDGLKLIDQAVSAQLKRAFGDRALAVIQTERKKDSLFIL